jgi:hypothetical protein
VKEARDEVRKLGYEERSHFIRIRPEERGGNVQNKSRREGKKRREVAGKGVLALPTGKQIDVGSFERYIYSSSGGKEECVNRKHNNNIVDMLGGGIMCIESGGGLQFTGGIIARTADRCLCGRVRKSAAASGGEQVVVTGQRGKVQNVYSRTVASVISQRDSSGTRADACRRMRWKYVSTQFGGYSEPIKMPCMWKTVISRDVYCMCEIVLQNSKILRRPPCVGKKKWEVRDGSKYGMVIASASYFISSCL